MTDFSPSHNPSLIGHDDAIRQIIHSHDSGRMHHAWLISGVEGIGKATLAFHMAHYILSGGENKPGQLNMNHPAARLVSNESHPDMFILRRPMDEKTGAIKDSISVEEARKIHPFLRKTATHGGWRIVIIDEAHALNRFGQNAILKVIEEPPEKCLIIITVTTPGALLPTIRSRCRVLPLQPLKNASMTTILNRIGMHDLDSAERTKLINLSAGSVGFALKLIQSEALPLYDAFLSLMQSLPDMDMARVHALADRMARKADAESFGVITRLVIDFLRQNVRAQALGQALGTSEAPVTLRFSGFSPLDRALQLWEKTAQIFATTDHANLDRKLAFVNAMVEVRRAVAY